MLHASNRTILERILSYTLMVVKLSWSSSVTLPSVPATLTFFPISQLLHSDETPSLTGPAQPGIAHYEGRIQLSAASKSKLLLILKEKRTTQMNLITLLSTLQTQHSNKVVRIDTRRAKAYLNPLTRRYLESSLFKFGLFN